MKKQLSLLIISLSWIAWLIAAMALPAHRTINNGGDSAGISLKHVEAPAFNFSSGSETIEIPEFKIDWDCHAHLGAQGISNFSLVSKYTLSTCSWLGSNPLFDIKKTFKHFYYSW